MKKEIIYTLPKIAKKLETGKPLEELESIMAAGVIRDWLKLHESKTGRPKKYATDAERLAARRESNIKANAKRREKKLSNK